MKKHILTDCDGCLCMWNEGFDRFMASKNIYGIEANKSSYSLIERYGIDPEQVDTFVTDYNESAYISDLKPFADSVEYIRKLVNQGFRFTVVTSISTNPQAKIYRTQNLVHLFGDIFDEIVCLETGINKSKELVRWKDSGYFWIEDHPVQAEAGHKAGLRTVLIKHPYNENYHKDLFPTVSHITPWKEIYEMVCKEYNLIP